MEMSPPEQEPLPLRKAGATPRVFERLDRCIALLARVLFGVAGAGLIAMLVLIVADVVGIKVFSRPVPGGIELVAFLAVVAIAFGVPQTQVMRGHVAVDFIAERFPRRTRLLVDLLMVLFSVGLFALMSYYSFKYAETLRGSGEVSMTQKIPFYPFVYAMAACFVVMLLTLVVDLAKAIGKVARQWTR